MIVIDSNEKSGQEELNALLNHMSRETKNGYRYHKVSFCYCKFIWKWKDFSSETKILTGKEGETSTISNNVNDSSQDHIDSSKYDQKKSSGSSGNSTGSYTLDKGKG